MQEVEKYRKPKADIRNQAKAKVKEITKEQREELLEEGRKEGKEYFLQKIPNTYPGCQCHLKYESPHPTACHFMVHRGYKNHFKIYLSST